MSVIKEFEIAQKIGEIVGVTVFEGDFVSETNIKLMLALAKKVEILSHELEKVKQDASR